MSASLDIPDVAGTAVSLRPHSPNDLQGIYERCIDPLTQQFTSIPRRYTREMAEQYLTTVSAPRPDIVSWAIESGGQYAGTIDLRAMDIDGGAGTIGFVTHPAFRGRGLMSEAVGLLLDHAFDTLRWQFVRWQAHAGNWASAKAVWRNGFPVPIEVPALLIERGGALDGWISTLRRGSPRTPVTSWDTVIARLRASTAPRA